MGVGQELIDALDNSQNGKITELLNRVDGRTVNETDGYGYTPLHLASQKNHVEAVAQLLAIPGVNVNARNNGGVTPIMSAAVDGSIEAIKMLLQQPAVEVNARGNNGRTAIMQAAACCEIESLMLLCEHPAVDLDIRANDGRGLEDVVGVQVGGPTEKSKCLDIIKEARRKRENTSQGQGQASAEEVRASSNYAGVTPIMWAAKDGSIEAIKMLLQQPAVEVNARDNSGMTAVMWAAAYCEIQVLMLLGEHPAVDLDIRTNDGEGLEDVVGVQVGGPTEKSKCLDIIMEARRKRENTSQGQRQASAEEVRAEVTKHYIDQIDNANLKIRERENKIKADVEAKNEKMKVLQKKQDSEQKNITMKLNEEKRIFEKRKNNLEQQLATLQQRHNHEKTILEDNFKKEAENDRQLLASLKITTDQLVRDLGKLDLDLESENDGAPSAPSAPSAPANIEAAKNTLECPVCLEIMRPPTRIWMCSNSHLVCQECREKIEGRMCPTCRTQRVDLRAHMAENFSMSLFND